MGVLEEGRMLHPGRAPGDCSDGEMETLFAPNCDLVISVLQRLRAQALWLPAPTFGWVAALHWTPAGLLLVGPWAGHGKGGAWVVHRVFGNGVTRQPSG